MNRNRLWSPEAAKFHAVPVFECYATILRPMIIASGVGKKHLGKEYRQNCNTVLFIFSISLHRHDYVLAFCKVVNAVDGSNSQSLDIPLFG